MKVRIPSYLAFAAFLSVLTIATVAFPTGAHAQGNLRIAAEAKLQMFPDARLNITVSPGGNPVTVSNFSGTGYRSNDSSYMNNVSGGGITTGVINGLSTGAGEGKANYDLTFTPSYTITNNTSDVLSFSFVYNISYGAFVSVDATNGTGYADTYTSIVLYRSETGLVSSFQNSLSTTSGTQQNNPSDVPGQLTGNGVIFPGQSSTFSFTTVVNGDTQYSPSAIVPEGSTAALLGLALPLIGAVAVVRRRKK